MFPAPVRKRDPVEGVELLPDRIRRSYDDVLKVYNAGVWTATATCCRRTLEGVVTELLPEPNRNAPLAANLKALSESVDLSRPVLTLSNALREGGNLGAHFDLDREPNREVAEAMVDLIDYLLEYVYTLPRLVEGLEQRLASLGNRS